MTEHTILETIDKIQYTRKKDKRKNGVMVAIVDPYDKTKVDIGFSFCSPKDEFNKELGKMIAINRCFTSGERTNSLNETIAKMSDKRKKDLRKFIDRCKTYYQNKERPHDNKQLPQWINTI